MKKITIFILSFLLVGCLKEEDTYSFTKIIDVNEKIIDQELIGGIWRIKAVDVQTESKIKYYMVEASKEEMLFTINIGESKPQISEEVWEMFAVIYHLIEHYMKIEENLPEEDVKRFYDFFYEGEIKFNQTELELLQNIHSFISYNHNSVRDLKGPTRYPGVHERYNKMKEKLQSILNE